MGLMKRMGEWVGFTALCFLLTSATSPSAPSAVTNNSAKNPSSAEKAATGVANTSAAAKTSEDAKKKAEAKARIKEEKKIGGVLYEQYSTALHTKRLRNEFTRAQWKTILLQKRIRIPLTAQDHHDMELFFIGD